MIPRAALLLGLAGVLPFAWGALSSWLPGLAPGWLPQRLVGPYVQVFYGSVILSFMSGVLWGFATRAEGRRAAIGYAVSVLPALWVAFLVGGGWERSSVVLIAGFVGLLALDRGFQRQGLAPGWWLRLRLLLTAFVVACLALPLL
ncbi:DUF3429 domain-containing protein [Limimaricola pyoseonensis]|uniref:DUF3429 domain-containing protein n=1 Tax=Limimaricola pyoseonensis TaxID=521013 RepID=A0A1G7E9W2_9RHOB|nr:DUF3429 domain-containing protein [Limimaricola pyoseonensis]SDE60236.1 Protein of unknown function [Limimaricola pyoseonensis]